VQDRYRGGGVGRQGSGGGPNRYGGGGGGGGNRRRRGRGGARPHDIYPEVGALEPEEHTPWAEDFEREPNPDAEPLHLAYDSVYTHEGDVREELLENWVEASNSGKRWRCWNCSRNTQRFTQLRLPTLRTVVSICDNCNTWTVWDAWRDLANPRIFSLRRTIEETEPAREPGAAESSTPPPVRSNGSGSPRPEPAIAPKPAVSAPGAFQGRPAAAPAAPAAPADVPPASAPLPGVQVALPMGQAPLLPEPSLQPTAEASPTAAEAKPKRAPRTRAKPTEGDHVAPKPRTRAKKTDEAAAE